MALLVGNAFFVGVLSVFLKDSIQLVNIVLQIGFWLTPVFWSDDSMSENVLKVLRLNPMHYVLMGYRHTLVDNVAFWNEPASDILYFWGMVILVGFIGLGTYKKLKNHFSDLL